MSRWQSAAACVGQDKIMFDSNRSGMAKSLCAVCPVRQVCLWSTMVYEGDRAAAERFGMAGGLGPFARRRLAEAVAVPSPGRQGSQELLEIALAAWEAAPAPAPALVAWEPPGQKFRRRRRCRGCPETIRQHRAGRPQEWCSHACEQRFEYQASGGKAAAAARQRWDGLDEEAKERKRAAARARWAALPAAERERAAAAKRRRRVEQREEKRQAS